MPDLSNNFSSDHSISDKNIEKIPFFIGVTGHRNIHIQAVDDVQKNVGKFFNKLKSDFPDLRFVVLSGLAEGVDQLVGFTALDADLELWAVLPTCISEYEKDFIQPEALEKFRLLLGYSSRVLNASTLNGCEENYSSRPKIYENLRDQLCRMSHSLIAVWDGKNDGAAGGTSDVVNTFLNGLHSRSSLSSISPPSCGDVFQILAPRSNDDLSEVKSHWIFANPFQVSNHENKNLVNNYLGRIKHCLNFFNQYNFLITNFSNFKSQFPQYLLPKNQTQPYGSSIDILGDWFSSAEKVASQYALKRQYALMFVIVNSLLFSLLVLSYGSLIDNTWPFIIGTVLLGSVYLFIISNWYKRIDSYYIFCRGFAEMLRIAIIWKACGIHQSISPIVLSSGIRLNDNLSFAAKSIDAISALDSEMPSDEGSASIVQHWVNSQIEYFSGNINKIHFHEKKSKLYKKISFYCILSAITFYFATFFADFLGLYASRADLTKFTSWSMFAFWTSLSLGTLSIAYSQVMGHDDHAVDYREALIKFLVAKKNSANGLAARGIAAELGIASLQEIFHWVTTKRRHPIKLPF
jgi:hypothetical protein